MDNGKKIRKPNAPGINTGFFQKIAEMFFQVLLAFAVKYYILPSTQE